MRAELLSFTGLPNLHPAVVHFPLALAPVAALFDVARLTVARDRRWLEPAATSLWVLSALGALAARYTGERAADALGDVSLAVEELLASHADQALIATLLIVLTAMGRLVLSHLERGRERPQVVWGTVALIPAVAALGALGFTADLGGRLVYGFGVAVQVADVQPRLGLVGDDAALENGAEARFATGIPVFEAGKVFWEPRGPASIGGGIAIESSSGPHALRPLEDSGPGLVLAVDGGGLLTLPGRFGDLRFEAELELGAFTGAVGLVFHRHEVADRFVVRREGETDWTAELARGDRTLDRGQTVGSGVGRGTDPGGSRTTLVVSSVGRHQKGLIDGETVVHGHAAALDDGGVGLQLEGRGTVRVLRLAIEQTM